MSMTDVGFLESAAAKVFRENVEQAITIAALKAEIAVLTKSPEAPGVVNAEELFGTIDYVTKNHSFLVERMLVARQAWKFQLEQFEGLLQESGAPPATFEVVKGMRTEFDFWYVFMGTSSAESDARLEKNEG